MAYMDESDDHALSNDQSHPSSEDMDVLFSGASGQVVLKKGPWIPAEDAILIDYVKRHGEGNWNEVQKYSGLSRCGKSCRLRWANHLRPNLKKGPFTAEEEQLIIELHAKLGNKWARMAAHLPGRTDNEIKNYWNTRVKRHHRAGLPLYPPNLYHQILNDSLLLQRNNEFSSGDIQHNQCLHPNNFSLYGAVFDSYSSLDQIKLFSESSLPNISVSKMLNQILGSSGCSNPVNLFKWLNETKTLFPTSCGNLACRLPTYGQYAERKVAEDYQSFYQCSPVDSDPGNKSLSAFGGTAAGSHALNGNFSTSQLVSGAVKLELPSFQYSDTDSSGRMMHVLSPLKEDSEVDTFTKAESGEPEPASPAYNGLLEALLYEAQAMGNAKKHKFAERSDSSLATGHSIGSRSPNDCHSELGTCDPVSTDASIFCNIPCVRSAPLAESSLNIPFGLDVKLESVEQIVDITEDQVALPPFDISRPDALLNSNWFIWNPIGNLAEEYDAFNHQESGESVTTNQTQTCYSFQSKDMSPVY